jgi:MFS family permease
MDVNGGEPLTAVDAATERTFRRTFFIMCICFGLNHAAVTTPVGYATSLLGTEVGNASNAALYGVCMISSLFLGPLFTSTLGPKNGLVAGMILYVIYVFCFAMATNYTETVPAQGSPTDACYLPPPAMNCTQINGLPAAWVFALSGATIGGIGAGSLWTAQGAFFGAISEQIADATGTPLQSISAQLASTFAIWYLGQECFWKVLFTVLSKWTDLQFPVLFGIYAALAAVATVVMFLGQDAKPKNAAARGPICARAIAAVQLWSDPKIWLLAGSNITFGFSASYLGGYINAKWQHEALKSDDFIGFLGAIICLIATISSKIYGVAAEKMGTKTPIVAVGSICFLGIALLSFVQLPCPDDGPCEGPGGWGWGIMIFYILQGMGRGVYESTNKGIFADFFPGEKSVGAFANCMVQNTFASTIGYVMGLASVDKSEVWILLVCSIVTVPGLAIAAKMKQSSALEEKVGVSA